jgi:transcriptional regulator with XRE-family HTH domain
MPFKENLKLVRLGLELSQDEFGKLVGATEGMIQTYEAGRNMPKTLVLNKISHLTGVAVETLIHDKLGVKEIEAVKRKYHLKEDDTNKNAPDSGANLKLIQAYEKIIALQESQTTEIDFEKTVISKLVNLEASNRVLLRLYAEQASIHSAVPVHELLKKYEEAIKDEIENLFSTL